MPDGIIYIARNEENPKNRYKVGKSDRVDPTHRMKELTDETSNIGEFKCEGYVVVDQVDECEKVIHSILNDYRTVPNREFFDCPIDLIKNKIQENLKDFIILDYLNNDNQNNKEKSRSKIESVQYTEDHQNHPINFINNLNSLNFYQVLKICFHQNWQVSGCSCTACSPEVRKIFFLLIYKKIIASKKRIDKNFIPKGNGLQIEGHTKEKINDEESQKLQDEILETNLKKLIDEITFEKFLHYFGEALRLININGIEEKNRKLADFFYNNLKKIYPKAINNFKILDSMRYAGGKVLNLEILGNIYNEHISYQKNFDNYTRF